MTNNYNIREIEKGPIILSWIGHKGLRFIQMLNDEEKIKCNTSTRLFKIISYTFKPQYNEMTLSLQNLQAGKRAKQNAEEWMNNLRKKPRMWL